MRKHSTSSFIFLFLALFAIVQITKQATLERIPFHIYKAELDEYQDGSSNRLVDMAPVQVSMGEEYYTANNLGTPGKRPFNTMLLFLFTNITGFGKGVDESFAAMTGEEEEKYSFNAGSTFSTLSSMSVWKGAKVNFTGLTIGNSSNPSWKLSNTAMYNPYTDTHYHIKVPSTSLVTTTLRGYLTNSSINGFIGMGVGGDAAKNFQGDHPLFSIQVNDTGLGNLIFGKDTSLYNAKRPSMSFPTSTNWSMETKGFTFGNISNTDYTTRLIFDVNHPGISFPESIFSKSFHFADQLKKLKVSINTTDETYSNNTSNRYTYYGNITDLPNLTFELTNGKVLSIPPQAYARRSAVDNNTWVLLFTYGGDLPEGAGETLKWYQYTVIGLPFLSSYYTVFEQKKGENATVTLYPTYDDPNFVSENSSSFLGNYWYLILLLVVVILVICKIQTQRSAAKLQLELNDSVNKKSGLLNA